MLDGAKEALSRKVGPLPLYGWAGVGVLGFVAYRVLTGGGSGTQQTLGQITDAAPGTGDITGGGGGSGDGVTQQPPVIPGTSGGNGKSYTTLVVTGATKSYGSASGGTKLGAMLGTIKPQATPYVVKRVTLAGKQYWQIIGKLGPGGTVRTDIPVLHRLIPASATTFRIGKTTPTQAAA